MSAQRLDATTTRGEALRWAAAELSAAGIPEARGDARHLLLHALALTPTELALRPERAIGEDGAAALGASLRRRRAGEPVARILGAWEFWGLSFHLSPDTLVPRPDTETLVEAALAAMPDRAGAYRLLDLGTGSGCLLVALLHERPNALALGLDRARGALETARANAAANGVAGRAAFVNGDWCAAVAGPFDLIVSNPPYIASGTLPALAVEVRRHDPCAALDGGADGLDAYRAIIGGVAARPGLLAPGGALMLEVGYDQAEAVSRLGIAAGFAAGRIARDLAGHERVVTLTPPLAVTSDAIEAAHRSRGSHAATGP